MRRDMDLIRSLLLQIESEEKADLAGYTKEQTLYHKRLLIEAGLAYGKALEDGEGKQKAVVITRLSWEGHEFLDAARNQSVWNKAKEKIAQVGASLAFPILKDLLAVLVKEQLGIK